MAEFLKSRGRGFPAALVAHCRGAAEELNLAAQAGHTDQGCLADGRSGGTRIPWRKDGVPRGFPLDGCPVPGSVGIRGRIFRIAAPIEGIKELLALFGRGLAQQRIRDDRLHREFPCGLADFRKALAAPREQCIHPAREILGHLLRHPVPVFEFHSGKQNY